MEKIITEKLWKYIVQNNPDLMLILKEEQSVFQDLGTKVKSVLPLMQTLQKGGTPEYMIQELCMEELTKDLRPSKFQYLRSLMEDEFEDSFSVMVESGILTYELINLMTACREIFERFNFSEETEQDRMLRYAVIGEIDTYLARLTALN